MDQELAREAAILTAIGVTTAFGLLVLLMIVVNLVSLFSSRVIDRVERRAAAQAATAEAESREKALAAVVAVGALLGDSAPLGRSTGGPE